MKRLLLMLPLLGMLTACCTDKKCVSEPALATPDTASVVYEELYAGTFPAADCSGIYYVLRLYTDSLGSDTLFTLDASYIDAEGDGNHTTFTTTGKCLHLTHVEGFTLHPDNGEPSMNFVTISDTIVRMVNDSLQEVGVNYDLVKITESADTACTASCVTCTHKCK